jgi:hypothetical protein
MFVPEAQFRDKPIVLFERSIALHTRIYTSLHPREVGFQTRRMTAMLSTIAEIIRDLLIFVGVIAALLITLLVIVSKMPDTNPLKRVLTALSYRLGATLAAGALAIPLEPIPGIDVLYDIGVPIVLVWYWFTFSKNAFGVKSTSSPSKPDHRHARSQ